MTPPANSTNAFRLGRYLGIEVFIDPWIALPFLFVATSSPGDIGFGILMMVIVFACVLVHEYGHALAARSCGVSTKSITLGMLGGVALLGNEPRSVKQDLWITIAGPLVNVAIWLGCSGVMLLLLALAQETEWLVWLAITARLNLWLLLFNLIPAFPMDGGRILHGLMLLTGQSRWKALQVTSIVACCAAIGLVAWGLWDWLVSGRAFPVFRLLIAWQVWVGAVYRLRFLNQIKHTHPELAPGPGEI